MGVRRFTLAAIAFAVAAIAQPARGERARGDFLEIEPSARLAALFDTAIPDEAATLAIFRAPASLATSTGWGAGASYARGIFSTSTQALSFVTPAEPFGFGAGLVTVRTDNVIVTDDQGQTVGRAAVFDGVGFISGGMRLGGGAAGGITLKGFISRIDDRSISGMALDAETRVAFAVDADRLKIDGTSLADGPGVLSVALRNAGAQGAFVRTSDPLPTAISLALAYHWRLSSQIGLGTYGNVEKLVDGIEPVRAAVGGEVSWSRILFARLAYRSSELQNHLGAGLGLRYAGLSLDWAYQPSGDLGVTQLVSLSYEIPH